MNHSPRINRSIASNGRLVVRSQHTISALTAIVTPKHTYNARLVTRVGAGSETSRRGLPSSSSGASTKDDG